MPLRIPDKLLDIFAHYKQSDIIWLGECSIILRVETDQIPNCLIQKDINVLLFSQDYKCLKLLAFCHYILVYCYSYFCVFFSQHMMSINNVIGKQDDLLKRRIHTIDTVILLQHLEAWNLTQQNILRQNSLQETIMICHHQRGVNYKILTTK